MRARLKCLMQGHHTRVVWKDDDPSLEWWQIPHWVECTRCGKKLTEPRTGSPWEQ